MAPSFLSWAKALSTSLRSSPERVATSPADTGLPALRMVSRTFAVVSIRPRVQRLTVCGKPCRVSQARGLPCVHGRQRPYCLLRPWRGHRSCAAGDRRVYEQGRGCINRGPEQTAGRCVGNPGIVRVGDYDDCACIGAHVGNTSDIGEFRIISHDFNDGVWRVRWKVIAKQ